MADRKTKINSSQIFDNGVMLTDLNEEVKIGSMALLIDNGDLVIEMGAAGDILVPFNCEIIEVTLLADQTGSIVIDIFKDTYANYPPATSITASTKPTLSSSIKTNDSTLTGWTKTIYAGEILRINVDSIASITRCLISFKIKKI